MGSAKDMKELVFERQGGNCHSLRKTRSLLWGEPRLGAVEGPAKETERELRAQDMDFCLPVLVSEQSPTSSCRGSPYGLFPGAGAHLMGFALLAKTCGPNPLGSREVSKVL